MMSRRINGALALLLILCAPVLMHASGPREEVGGAERGVVPMRVFKPGLPETWPDDPLVAHWNQKLNIELEFVSPSWSDWSQKLNLLLSTGADMDVYTLAGDAQWVSEEAILQLDDLLDRTRYPYLYSVCNSETYKGLKFDGKIYHIPGPNHGTTWGLVARKDWMDDAGLGMPKNEKDFMNLLKAFRDSDPSGQTVGWCIEGAFAVRRSIFPVLLSYGVPTMMLNTKQSFYVEGDELKSVVGTPELKAALKYLNSLYVEGLINTDFPSMNFPKINEKYIKSGKTGVVWADFGNTVQTFTELGGEAVGLEPWSASGYTFKRGGGGLENMVHTISATSENPLRALDFVEYMNSKEGRLEANTGIEGVHWENLTSDGYYDRLPQYEVDYGTQKYLPYEYYLGAHHMRGWIPAAEYSTFERAYANINIVEDRAARGTPTDTKIALAEGAKWAEGPHPFKFWSVPALREIDGEVTEAITTGLVKVIAAPAGEFEQEYAEAIDLLQEANFDMWMAEWNEFWKENIK